SNIPFKIANLLGLAGFTADLDLDSIAGSGDTAILTTSLGTFANLDAGSSDNFLASFNTSTIGSFEATYTLSVSDENLPGATAGPNLLLTLRGNVIALESPGEVPEPSNLLLLLLGLGLSAHTYRRRAMCRRTLRRSARSAKTTGA